jgi:hypothetical protein
MATPKKKPSNVLTWNSHPDGGHYAHYKLGTIFRYKGTYSYKTSYNKYFNAESLAQAKKMIDQYTNARMKELRASKSTTKNKKR